MLLQSEQKTQDRTQPVLLLTDMGAAPGRAPLYTRIRMQILGRESRVFVSCGNFPVQEPQLRGCGRF